MKEFSPFRVDTVNDCLWRADERLPLTPQAFSVLRYLVDRAGGLVTQEELLEALWPDTAVQPEVLKTNILSIRRALGDDAKAPRFIQTYPRRGYSFIAEVRDVIEEATDVQPANAATIAPEPASFPPSGTGALLRRLRQGPLLWAAAGALTVVALATLSLRTRGSLENRTLMWLSTQVDLGDSNFRRLTHLAVSPDGKRVVFDTTGKEAEDVLAIRSMDHPGAVPLVREGSDPFFSPDGEWVGFWKDAKLWRISVEGGAPAKICDSPNSRGASWGSDDYIVAALDRVGGLSRVAANGGTPVAITQLDPSTGETSHRWPQVLPGGDTVLFTAARIGNNPDGNSIEVVSLKTGRRKTLWNGGTYARYLPTGHLIFVSHGTLHAAPLDLRRLELTGAPRPVLPGVGVQPASDDAYFDFSQAGTFVFFDAQATDIKSSVLQMDLGGKTEHLVPGDADYDDIRFSPDGSRLAFQLTEGSMENVWVYDLARSARVLVASGAASEPYWSRDGRYVIFETRGANRDGIAAARADGGGQPIQLLDQRSVLWVGLSISLSGELLAYAEQAPATGDDIWLLPIDLSGAAPKRTGDPRAFLQTPANEGSPSFSPDGRWLAYISNESGEDELYVRSFPGQGGKWQVTATGALNDRRIAWSPKGHKLYYLDRAQNLVEVPYTASAEVFAPGKPRAVSSMKIQDFDVAPDGRSFAILVDAQSGDQKAKRLQATVLVGFFDELRRRIPVK